MPKDTVEEKIVEFKRNYTEYIELVSIGQYDNNSVNIGYKSARELMCDWIEEALTTAYNKGVEDGKLDERQFILNVLDGVDIADEQMGNSHGGTLAIRHALKNRIIKEPEDKL